MKYPSSSRKGFTLVETLIAIAVLMLAILGPLTVASKGLQNSLYARDQITAYYLAQEGIEYARFARDDNYIQGREWLYGLDECMMEGGTDHGCVIDVPAWFDDPSINPVLECTNVVCSNNPMVITEDSLYTYESDSGSSLSRFSRIVTIEVVEEGKEVKVTSTVSWRAGSFAEKSFSITENIFNIYQ